MNKTERNELASVVKRRFKVMRVELHQRRAEALADFEEQVATTYQASDERWKEIVARAQQAARDAEVELRKICADEGIPIGWAPTLSLGWYGRGRNAEKQRVTELRKVATARLDAQVRTGKLVLERQETDLLVSLAAGSLESDEARTFLTAIPAAVELVPGADLVEIETAVAIERPRDDVRTRKLGW